MSDVQSRGVQGVGILGDLFFLDQRFGKVEFVKSISLIHLHN